MSWPHKQGSLSDGWSESVPRLRHAGDEVEFRAHYRKMSQNLTGLAGHTVKEAATTWRNS